MTGELRLLIGGLMALSALAASPGHADDQATNGDSAPTAAASERDIAESLKKLIFVPHDSGAPAVTDAGGVRAVTVLPKVELLAPERMARTLSPTPTLYWHVSKASSGPVRFTLLADDPSVIDPILEVEVDGIDREGIYGVDLGEHGVALDDGRRYIWSVALAASDQGYGADLVAQTVMERRAVPDLESVLDYYRPEDRAIRLAAEGYWYDAVDALSDQIEKDGSAPWRDARAHLLDQAGLLQAARFDHRQASQ